MGFIMIIIIVVSRNQTFLGPQVAHCCQTVRVRHTRSRERERERKKDIIHVNCAKRVAFVIQTQHALCGASCSFLHYLDKLQTSKSSLYASRRRLTGKSGYSFKDDYQCVYIYAYIQSMSLISQKCANMTDPLFFSKFFIIFTMKI
jgi:hypothetical protein